MIMDLRDAKNAEMLIKKFGDKVFTQADFDNFKDSYPIEKWADTPFCFTTLRNRNWLKVVRVEHFCKVKNEYELAEYDITKEEFFALPPKVRDALDVECINCGRYYYVLDMDTIKKQIHKSIEYHHEVLAILSNLI